MSRPFQVSVIIPVYNAKRFVRKAVESAIALDEVAEIILIDDGFNDGALELCLELAAQSAKVKLLRHPNGENRGAGASRNLGILHAACDYIAFLDADDWYLPNRFLRDRALFESDSTIDGVYGCTQTVIDDNGVLTPTNEYSTVNGIFSPLQLTLGWLAGTTGAFTTNAITVRKSLFHKTGYFDTSLRLHQDSHLYYRFLWYGNIVAGEIVEPIAVRRKHPDNRIAKKDISSKHQFYRKLFESYESVERLNKFVYRKLFHRYVSTFGRGRIVVYFFRLICLLRKPERILKIM